jgi:hypothetical protein
VPCFWNTGDIGAIWNLHFALVAVGFFFVAGFFVAGFFALVLKMQVQVLVAPTEWGDLAAPTEWGDLAAPTEWGDFGSDVAAVTVTAVTAVTAGGVVIAEFAVIGRRNPTLLPALFPELSKFKFVFGCLVWILHVCLFVVESLPCFKCFLKPIQFFPFSMVFGHHIA